MSPRSAGGTPMMPMGQSPVGIDLSPRFPGQYEPANVPPCTCTVQMAGVTCKMQIQECKDCNKSPFGNCMYEYKETKFESNETEKTKPSKITKLNDIPCEKISIGSLDEI